MRGTPGMTWDVHLGSWLGNPVPWNFSDFYRIQHIQQLRVSSSYF